MTTETGIVKQTTWWPLYLFSRYMRGHTVGVHVCCPEYDGPTQPSWIRGTIQTPWLDVSASLSDDGWVSMAIVNVHDTRGFRTRILGANGDIEVYTITGSNVRATNTEHSQEVGIEETKWNGEGLFEFPRHSITMLRWKAK